jgi:hypothetical protein
MTRRTRGSTFFTALLACGPALGGNGGHAGHDVGRVPFPTSCAPAVQPDFEHGVALLHHMTYPQAQAAFEDVAKRDPACAMAQWGVAMTLFTPLWPTRPSLEERTRGWQAVERARALRMTPREQALVDATAAFFQAPAADDYWARIGRWEASLAKAHAAFPQDDEIAALYALATLATTPADRADRTHADRAAALLAQVRAHQPGHPGAMHYLVHASDVPGREHESIDNTRAYEDAAPDNPHALHMPTHVYVRLGDWDGVVRGNLRAAEAALRHPAGARGEYVWDEFPHAIEYLVHAYLQQGKLAEAAKQRDRLRGTPNLQPSFKTAFHLASTQARCALEPRDWQAAYAIAPRRPSDIAWDKFPWAEAIAQFAHGLGAAHIGKREDARAAHARLGVLQAIAGDARELLFERNIHMLRLELESAMAYANGHPAEAIEKLQAAAELERNTPKPPVTPAPTLPADELLGDLYVELGREDDARAAYQRVLARYPNRGWATQRLAVLARHP